MRALISLLAIMILVASLLLYGYTKLAALGEYPEVNSKQN